MIKIPNFRLPEHKGGLYLEHNVYKNVYDSIETAVTYLDEDDCWVSTEERQNCLNTGEIWSLQWYPDTPVGFCKVIGSTLEAVLRAACGGPQAVVDVSGNPMDSD